MPSIELWECQKYLHFPGGLFFHGRSPPVLPSSLTFERPLYLLREAYDFVSLFFRCLFFIAY